MGQEPAAELGQILKLLSLWNGRQMWNLNISLEGENGIVSGRVSRKVLAGDRFSSGSYCETPGLRGQLCFQSRLCILIPARSEEPRAPQRASPFKHPLWLQHPHTDNEPTIVLILGAWVWGTFSTSWAQFSSSVKWSFWLPSVVLCCGIKWNNMYYIFCQSNTHTLPPHMLKCSLKFGVATRAASRLWGLKFILFG